MSTKLVVEAATKPAHATKAFSAFRVGELLVSEDERYIGIKTNTHTLIFCHYDKFASSANSFAAWASVPPDLHFIIPAFIHIEVVLSCHEH